MLPKILGFLYERMYFLIMIIVDIIVVPSLIAANTPLAIFIGFLLALFTGIAYVADEMKNDTGGSGVSNGMR